MIVYTPSHAVHACGKMKRRPATMMMVTKAIMGNEEKSLDTQCRGRHSRYAPTQNKDLW
jgi:hypothetical protein